jgi:hypothetical protein
VVGKAQRLRPNIRSRSPRSASSSCKSGHQWIPPTNAQFESALQKARKQPGAAHVEILLALRPKSSHVGLLFFNIRPVVPHPIKRADFSRHGYRAAQFEDAFARFLPHEPNIRTLKHRRERT